MTFTLRTAAIVVAMLPLAACVEDTGSSGAGTPAVGSPTDLTAFQGARAGQAEMGIQNLGYELSRTDGSTAYWLNRATDKCAEIVTADGRYETVTMLPGEDC